MLLLTSMESHNQLKLKGWISVGRTVNLGRFNSIKLELASDFHLDESTHEEVLRILLGKLDKALRDMGVVARYD